jgi:hypothetical protein
MICFYINTKIDFYFNTQTAFYPNAKKPLQPNDYRYKLAANTTTPVSSTSYLEDKQLTIPLNQCLCFLHFRKQVGITNNPSCISDFTTSLVQPRDHPHNGSFGNISQLDDFREWLLVSFISYGKGRHTIPPAHSYTTSTNPTLYFSLNSS